MNSENDNLKNENQSNNAIGLKKRRGQNILTKELKNDLYNVLKKDIENLNMLLNSCSYEERAKLLKGLLRYLLNYEDDISINVREILWKQLEGHYNKLQFYIPHLTPKNKVIVLQGFLNNLAPVHRKKVVESIKKQNIKF